MNSIFNLIFLFFLFSIPYLNTKYIINDSLPDYLNNTLTIVNDKNSTINGFRMLLELIGICVLNYFYLFKVCYLGSINVILICVTNYFITFNYLFMGSLDLIKDCILNSYTYSLNMVSIICNFPNNFLIFIYFITKLYLDNRLRPI